jgi:hypothetical protein
MIADIEFMEHWFPIYNKEYFEGKLPTPQFQLFKSKHVLGQFEANRRLDIFANPINNAIIRMSTFLDRDERALQTTLLHEMIHLFIHTNNIIDTSSHGICWTKKANEINQKGGWDIQATSSIAGTTVNPAYTKRNNTATMMAFHRGGQWFVFCVSPSSVDYFKKLIKNNYSRYVIGLIDKDQCVDFPLCRKNLHGDRVYESDFVTKYLSKIDIQEKEGI